MLEEEKKEEARGDVPADTWARLHTELPEHPPGAKVLGKGSRKQLDRIFAEGGTPDGVVLIWRWRCTSDHERAKLLRDSGYGWETIARHHEEYLRMARASMPSRDPAVDAAPSRIARFQADPRLLAALEHGIAAADLWRRVSGRDGGPMSLEERMRGPPPHGSVAYRATVDRFGAFKPDPGGDGRSQRDDFAEFYADQLASNLDWKAA